ncbi:MAG: esterase family protein [Lachnospiraceae bacterium]|nr:esterase family protein [Lachnospiraceae bacterium]
MLFVTYKIYSTALGREADTQVIIPTAEPKKRVFEASEYQRYPKEPMKVLYLLHGGFGCSEDWLTMSPVASMIRGSNLMIVMPFAENSYYQDMPYGSAYWTFVSEELPVLIRQMFPHASTRREDTFAAGLSMGGYGAFRLGLAKPENFAAVASLSGVLDLKARIAASKGELKSRGLQFTDNFFNEDEIGDADLLLMMEKVKDRREELPRFFFTVGTEDFVYGFNQTAKKKMEACGIAFHYEEHKGAHEWDFWNKYIENALRWMKAID